MTRWQIKICALVLAVLGGALPLFGNDDRDEIEKLNKALTAAKVTLAEAAKIAENAVPGGQTLEIELEWKHGGPRIEVELATGEMWKEVYVNAASARIVRIEEDRPDNDEERAELQRDKQTLAATKVTFAEALEEAVKKEPGGRPVKIELESRNGRPEYKVKLLTGDRLATVRVAAAN